MRRPVALALADDDARLYVANRASGSISVIDTTAGCTVDETDVGRAVADLAITPDGRYLLAIDEAADELIAIERRPDGLRVAARRTVAKTPVSVCVSSDGTRCFVASLWGQSLTAIDASPANTSDTGRLRLRSAKTIHLPFAPRLQCLVDDGARLVVADAFAGRLAVFDTRSLALVAMRELAAGHNIRGLAVTPDGKQLLIAHQVLNSHTETSQGNVWWGAVMTNVVRAVSIEDVIAPGSGEGPLLGTTQNLGNPGDAAGDPAGLAVTPEGDAVVALAGVHEVAIRRAGQNALLRIAAGRRPNAIALDAAGRRAFVANTFGDSISVVDLEERRLERTISLGPRPKLSPAERGEMLFHDARLSLDGWFSCHSCHTDGHTTGLLSDNLGDGSTGAAKRIPSLLGTADTGPWAWDGHFARLEDQVRSSIQTTMRGRKATDEQVAAIVAYLGTLAPPPVAEPLDSARRDRTTVGLRVFEREGCSQCHTAPAFTSAGVHDVGLTDERGASRFNPPSLRGVGRRGALFHDNRAATLEQVFTRFRHGLTDDLSPVEIESLQEFLRSL
ncbi:MAG: hypothetical protein HYX69_16510 [Planctomycetia bacterium]|nr:hypothetical protein [Planctomycetia bacterium]